MLTLSKPALPRRAERVQGLAGRVAAPQEPEQVVVQTLHADAQPADARIQQRGELARVQVVRVRLRRYLRAAIETARPPNGIEQHAQAPFGQVGWRAAAEEHGLEPGSAQYRAPELYLRPERSQVRPHLARYARVGV